jgi:hypothetical protein
MVHPDIFQYMILTLMPCLRVLHRDLSRLNHLGPYGLLAELYLNWTCWYHRHHCSCHAPSRPDPPVRPSFHRLRRRHPQLAMQTRTQMASAVVASFALPLPSPHKRKCECICVCMRALPQLLPTAPSPPSHDKDEGDDATMISLHLHRPHHLATRT